MAGLDLGFDQVTRLLNEPDVLERVKLEDYLLVAAGVRPAGMVAIPAEFPDGQALGQAIDEKFSLLYYRGYDPSRPALENLAARGRRTLARVGLHPIRYKAMLMGEAFAEVVYGSASYRAHRHWATRMGLEAYEVEIRPTVREFYLYRGKATLARIQELTAHRRRVQVQARSRYTPAQGRIPLVYPEEFEATFLQRLGELLGYPACCVEQYARDRTTGTNVELRAARQLEEARRGAAGDAGGPEPAAAERAGPAEGGPGWRVEAYWVKDFFPCRPDCPEAAARGRAALAALEAVDPRLAKMYARGLEQNLERIERYPEIVRMHEDRLRERIREQFDAMLDKDAERHGP